MWIINLLLAIGEAEIGVKEIPGIRNNPRILHYSKKCGQRWVKSESTSWCGLFLGFAVMEIPDFMRPRMPTKPQTAREWLKVGVAVPIEKARPGDIAVFWRLKPNHWTGHCGIIKSLQGDSIRLLAGNQSDSVCYMDWPKQRLLGIRRL